VKHDEEIATRNLEEKKVIDRLVEINKRAGQ